MSQTIFSGIQPSGVPTLGNYLGAMRNCVDLQNKKEEQDNHLYCIVDLHAITVFQKPTELKNQIIQMTAALLACGIDPTKSILFVQSSVSTHARLAWIFNCVARIGWLNRMAQFKEKSNDKERESVGLYAYPVLMAADICAYHATHVPVGDDQKQHIELANDIADKFNYNYGVNFFPKIFPIYTQASRVMSLRDGTKKMSKSDPSDQTRINLTDGADSIAFKIKRATTDALPIPEFLDGFNERPEALNLITIYTSMAEISVLDVLKEFGGKGFNVLKERLTEILVEKITPIGAEINRLMIDDVQHIKHVLSEGQEKASDLSEPIVRTVEELIVGLGWRD